MTTIYTTSQVAKFCKVSPRTVCKWFDNGRLKGYRIPGSNDRRIPKDLLIRFLKEHGMPLGELGEDAMVKVLIVGSEDMAEPIKSKLEEAAPEAPKILLANSGFEAGIQAESTNIDCAIIDLESVGRTESVSIAKALTNSVVIGILDEDYDAFVYESGLFADTFRKPVCTDVLVERALSLSAAKQEGAGTEKKTS